MPGATDFRARSRESLMFAFLVTLEPEMLQFNGISSASREEYVRTIIRDVPSETRLDRAIVEQCILLDASRPVLSTIGRGAIEGMRYSNLFSGTAQLSRCFITCSLQDNICSWTHSTITWCELVWHTAVDLQLIYVQN
ncbi:hypothetical protein QAD02_007312 [Eretmocerus hayati]|uniref:Uncharacterized protein n=1 Tax=Eretmocerus hayati TaxID=131215 RepID=A0ACC2N397_9HYME|nr:hypothetical protein QAD02_007312 [Eretmocerus hayati]